MRKLFILLALCIATFGTNAQVSKEAFDKWHANKYSMFIHFGLYSELGGVWDGKPVTRGYSEQIQSFAGIFSDWYGSTAKSFNPINFNADSIVAFAKRSGMKSIVITSKHHDGFCMFRTATTDYNSYDATPCKRDFVKEMAEACKRAGINFGIYFSLIDWHYPHAYPISSHNSDFITPQHHQYNKAQVTELLTNYGSISELWFDMGANTPQQSKELYDLVHKLQPNCMVSGRLGNDFYDFSVMADNKYPESTLQTAWQSAASMFDETWSYRSWQQRGEVKDKVNEKLRSLINVVSHGGNFLLNIGPKGDGSVVEFERQVLEQIGSWLDKNGEAIYNTEASPFQTSFDWGAVTQKDNTLYLILSGKRPTNDRITLTVPDTKLLSCNTKTTVKGNQITFLLDNNAYGDEISVIKATFNHPVEKQITQGERIANHSYSCFDYYSNYRSDVSYQWNIVKNNLKELEFTYTSQEIGKELSVEIDGKNYTLTLTSDNPQSLTSDITTTFGDYYLCGPTGGMFDSPSVIRTDINTPPTRYASWQKTDKNTAMFDCDILETYYLMQNIEIDKAHDIIMDIGAGNGIEVYLNGRSVMKHLNPYRCKFREEKILLPLEKGNNQIVLRMYNRFEKQTGYLLKLSNDQVIYKQRLTLPKSLKGRNHTVIVRQNNLPSIHKDTELSNLSIDFR